MLFGDIMGAETVKDVIESKEVRNVSLEFLSDLASAILGDKVAMARLGLKIVEAPIFWTTQIFWIKFENFINGVYIDEDTRIEMAAKLASKGTKEDNAIRLISAIDHSDSMKKIQFLVNASRCLLAGFIDLDEYFRICKVVSDTLLEDLVYMSDHISEENLEYSNEVQGLLSSGVMYMSTIDKTPLYSFTPIATKVEKFAVSYNDVNKYPDPTKCAGEKQISVSVSTMGWGLIAEEKDIIDLVNKTTTVQ